MIFFKTLGKLQIKIASLVNSITHLRNDADFIETQKIKMERIFPNLFYFPGFKTR